jgi:predicted RNase H-like nuclease (RuvC/YqgF family)
VTSPDRHDPADRSPPAEPVDGLGALVRRVLTPGRTPEERLEEILAERRRELDEHAARFDASIADLERREELLRDSRASVERMLRMRTSDLEARETELTDFLRDLAERESSLARAEGDLARRRGEVGAVELKRAAVERRERAVAEREERLGELEARLDSSRAAPDYGGRGVPQSTRLAFVPGVDYRLLEVERTGVASGDAFELEGEEYVVARTGPSPLPGDRRRCAYLVRGTRGESPPGSS